MSTHQFVMLLHILGAGVVIGVVFFSLVISLDKPLDDNKLKFFTFIRRFGFYAVFWQFVTGLHFLSTDFDELVGSKVFWTKMVLIVVDGIIAERLIKAKVERAQASGDLTTLSKDLPVLTWASALVILSVVTLGFFLVIGYQH